MNSGIIGKAMFSSAFGAESSFGCWFESDISNWLPSGWFCTQEDSYYVVNALTEENAAAKIGDKLYASLAVAAGDMKNGDTLVLLQSCTGESTIEVKINQGTIDLNGHSITNASNPALKINPYNITPDGEPGVTITSSSPAVITGCPALQTGTSNDYMVPITLSDNVTLASNENADPLELGSGSAVSYSEKYTGYIRNGGFKSTYSDGKEYIYGGYGSAAKYASDAAKTVTLLNDYTTGSSIKVNRSGTLDLNGKVITYTESNQNNDSAAIEFGDSNISLTLKNGKINSSDHGIWVSYNGGPNLDNNTLVMDGITMTVTGQNDDGNGNLVDSYGIMTNGMMINQNITIRNSTITSNGAGIYFPSANSTLRIENSSITGTTGIAVKGGDVTIINSNITGTLATKTNPTTPINSGFNETGDAIYVEEGYTDRTVTVTIQGGSFVSVANEAARILTSDTDSSKKDIEIESGQFSSDVKEYIKQNYDQLVTKNGTQTPFWVGQYTDTGAANTMNSNIYKLSLPSGVDVYYMSEGEAEQAAEDAGINNPTITPITKPAGTSSNDSSDSRANANFWEDVEEEIRDAASGEIVKVDARSFDRMPESVMEALRENPGVSLVVEWNGGETITIPAGEARSPEAGRIYYPLSLLVELYDGSTLTNPETGGVLDPALLNPETGGVHVVTAPETPIQEEVTITPSTEGVTGGTTGTAPSVGEAGEAETAGPVQAAETAEESSGAGGVAIAFVVLALAGGAILWLMLRRDKNTRG